MSSLLILSFIVYALILCCISFAAAHFQTTKVSPTSDDKSFIGNRSVNYWVTALSAHASDMSDWLFLAFPAQIFLYGSDAYIIAFALVGGMWATWHFVAIPLRQMSEQYQAITLIDYLETRFDAQNSMLRLLATSITLFFFTMYIAAGIKGIGIIGESTFNVAYPYGTAIGSLLVLAIALIGGFLAAAWTDCFQAIFLLGVILLVPSMLFFQHPSINEIATNAASRSLSLIPFSHTSWHTLLNNMAWGLGYFGMPHILTKLLGSNNAQDLKKAKYIGLTWQILALTGALFVGIIAIGYVLPGTIAPEQIFIQMVLQNFNPFIAGLMLCGVLAATLSTMLSQLLLVATTFTHDFYHTLINKSASSKHIQNIYRVSLLFFMLFAYSVAYPKNISIFSLVQYAWSGLGSSFGPLVLVSLTSYSISKQGALAGLIGGALGSGLWRFFNGDLLWLGYSITEMIPGYCVAFAALGVVSYITKK